MEVFIGVLLLVGGIAAAYGYTVIAHRHTVEAWKAAAERFHLQFDPGDRVDDQKIWGVVKGHTVKVDTFKKGNSSMMRFRVDYLQPIGIGLKITSESFFAGFSKMLGEQDIEIGIEPFDRMALIKGLDEDRVRALLDKERRKTISQALRDIPDLHIEDDHVYLVRAVMHSASDIVSLLVQMLSVAACMSRSDEASPPVIEAARVEDLSGFEQMPPVADAPEELAPLPVEPEEEPFEQEPIEPEDLPEEIPDEELVLPEDLPEEVPEEELVGFESLPEETLEEAEESVEPEEAATEHQDQHDEAEEPTEEPEVETVEEPPVSIPAEPTEICRELFASGISSISVDSVFGERFRGRQVCWQGLLRSFSRYSYDPALGDGPALKVQLDLVEIEADYGSRRMVEAIVQMPLSHEAELTDRKGEILSFTGELHRADGLMFRIYLTSGEVIQPETDHAAP
jgi:hypothetical protein